LDCDNHKNLCQLSEKEPLFGQWTLRKGDFSCHGLHPIWVDEVHAKTIDWAYTNSKAIYYIAEEANVPRDIAKQAVDEFFPKEALRIGGIRGLETTLRDALQYKLTTRQLTPTDVEALIDIVFEPGSYNRRPPIQSATNGTAGLCSQ
jgi:hypothetical protein